MKMAEAYTILCEQMNAIEMNTKLKDLGARTRHQWQIHFVKAVNMVCTHVHTHTNIGVKPNENVKYFQIIVWILCNAEMNKIILVQQSITFEAENAPRLQMNYSKFVAVLEDYRKTEWTHFWLPSHPHLLEKKYSKFSVNFCIDAMTRILTSCVMCVWVNQIKTKKKRKIPMLSCQNCP